MTKHASAALIAALLLGAITGSCNNTDGGQVVRVPVESVEETEPGVLRVVAVASPCTPNPTLSVIEGDNLIEVASEAEHTGAGDCDDLGQLASFTHELSAPVGARRIEILQP